jgi:hypothetical protein
MAEADWDGWRQLTDRIGDRVQLVGDDIFVTNPAILRQGIERGIANSVLIRRHRRRSDQDGAPRALGARGQVQPAPAHRGGARRPGTVRRSWSHRADRDLTRAVTAGAVIVGIRPLTTTNQEETPCS